MVFDLSQRRRLRQTVYWLLVAGVVVGVAVFFFGDDAVTAVRTLTAGSPTQATVNYKVKLYNDANGNGTQDALEQAEHLVKNADLSLDGGTGVQLTKNTGDTGEVVFEKVVPGTYALSATLAGSALSVAPSSVSIVSGAPDELLAAATSDAPYSGITGTVVLDRDGDGEANDVGFDGIEVQLLLNDVVQDSVDTDQSGRFTFTNVEPNTYTVRVVMTPAEQREYNVASLPEAETEVLSLLHRPNVVLLIRTRGPSAAHTTFRLAQASPSAGFLLEKSASDADEQDQEFITTKPTGSLSFSITIEPFASSLSSVAHVRASDVLPSIVIPTSIGQNGTFSGNTITWDLGTLPVDQKIELTYEVNVSGSAASGFYDNVVTVTGDQAEPDDDDVTVIVTASGLATTTNLPSTRGPVVPVGESPTVINGVRPGAQPAPETGAPAWVVSSVLTILMLAIGGTLLGEHLRTHRQLDDRNRTQ